jgi:hypothetical protein
MAVLSTCDFGDPLPLIFRNLQSEFDWSPALRIARPFEDKIPVQGIDLSEPEGMADHRAASGSDQPTRDVLPQGVPVYLSRSHEILGKAKMGNRIEFLLQDSPGIIYGGSSISPRELAFTRFS